MSAMHFGSTIARINNRNTTRMTECIRADFSVSKLCVMSKSVQEVFGFRD